MPKVKIDEVRRFMEDSLKAVGAPESEARKHAALLLQADLTGHPSHGLNRLEFYIGDCQNGVTNPKAKPVVLKETPSTAWVDGCDGLGATVGNFCMDIAIKKAKETGIGWVAAKRCNHFGMAGWWAQQAEREGLIGLAFTNTMPVMVATRAKTGTLGTNPIAMCAPAGEGDSILVDLATTTVALGKIEVQLHKNEPIPAGWALGPDGKITTDSKVAFDSGRLLPLGGLEQNSGYKGFCLSAMVETICCGLSGSKAAHNIRSWNVGSDEGAPNIGQCFAAINPNCFAPGFAERVADCLQSYRGLEPVDPSLPVLAPGDKERINEQKAKERGTIAFSEAIVSKYEAIAKKIGIKAMALE